MVISVSGTPGFCLLICNCSFCLLLYWHIGLLVIVLTMVGAITGIRIQARVNDYRYNITDFDLHECMYMKSHYRVNTYLIGVVVGCIFFKKYWITSLSINKWLKLLIHIVLWVVAIVLPCLAPIYCTKMKRVQNKTCFMSIRHRTQTLIGWSSDLACI